MKKILFMFRGRKWIKWRCKSTVIMRFCWRCKWNIIRYRRFVMWWRRNEHLRRRWKRNIKGEFLCRWSTWCNMRHITWQTIYDLMMRTNLLMKKIFLWEERNEFKNYIKELSWKEFVEDVNEIFEAQDVYNEKMIKRMDRQTNYYMVNLLNLVNAIHWGTEVSLKKRI